jgi:Zn-dependent protease with chaperone function
VKTARAFAFCAAALACAFASAPEIASAQVARALPGPPWPAPSRAAPDVSTDEGGLWGVSERAETLARNSAQLNEDEELNAYVRGVACKVAGEFCGDIRLYVMERPFFNASMAPNGYMEVWSGLMLRAENEAELAFVLGHEVGHFEERHSIETWRTVRGRATAAMVFSIGTAAAGAGYVGDLVYLGTLASVFGYSRENESAADRVGFERAVAAGYDARAGETIWSNLIAETRASDIEDVRRSETRNSIFRTHPLSAERVAALARLAEAQAAPSAGDGLYREPYRAAIRPFLDPWLRAELRRRDFGQTLLLLDRLGAQNEDLGVIEFYRGEAHRLRRGEGDLAQAKQHYLSAVQYGDAPAEAWRELGDMHARDGEDAETLRALRNYLVLAPDAEDRLLIEAQVNRLAPPAPPAIVEAAPPTPVEASETDSELPALGDAT